MKNFTIKALVLFSLFSINSFGQTCPNNSLVLKTQAAIDAFPTTYPGCTTIQGNIVIDETTQGDIVNLAPLSQLTTVLGDIRIFTNQNLTSLIGLDNISSVGGILTIHHNHDLPNFTGLEGLTSVGGFFLIYGNASMVDLTGLDNLTSFGSYVEIRNQGAMTSLTGLESLTSINGFLEISDNPALTTLSGIQNIDPSGITDLIIKRSGNLSICELPNICSYLDDSTNTFSISGNAIGCRNKNQILTACTQDWYEDLDNDTYGNINVSVTSASQPLGFVQDTSDCDDTDANVYPNAPELCDGVDNNCDGAIDETCCPMMANMTAIRNTGTSVHLGWDKIDQSFGQRIRYREVGSSTWVNINPGITETNGRLITGLTPNTDYEYRGRVLCGSIGNSNYTPIQTFNTYTSKPCAAPTGSFVMYHKNWDYSRVRLMANWEPDASLNGRIQVEWKPLAASTWTRKSLTGKSYIFALNLLPDTEYEVRWRARCGNAWTAWTSPKSFHTLESTAPLAPLTMNRKKSKRLEADTEENAFSAFPNPVSNTLYLDFGTLEVGCLRLLDAQGKVVQKFHAPINISQIDMSNFNRGMYFLQVITEAGRSVCERVLRI